MLVTLALFVLLSGVWSKGYPIGTDAWGHIAKAEYLADQIREEGTGAYFSTSWMPNWYMGDAFRTFYPPLTTLILTPIAYLFRDPGQIHKLFASLAVLVFAALCYVSFFRMSSPWPAALGTILALWAPYQLRTLFFEGNYPRILALLALPPIALFSQRLLDRSRPKMPTVIVLSLCWAWAILAHPQQALIFAIGFVFYIVVRLFIDADIPLNWGAWWTAGVVAGALLTALWILPAYSRGEIPQVPYLPQEKVALFSTSIESILPAADITGGQILFGFGTIIMALLAATARPDKNRSAWVFAGIISIWLSFGPRGVLFNLLPLSSQLLPERFLNFATFALAIGASGLLPIGNRARWARVIVVVGAVFIDLFPGWGLIGNHPYPYQQALLSDIDCPDGSSDCRIALLTYPEPDSLEVYFAGQDGRLINGWALENTPHHRALRRVLSATEWSPEYLQHILSLWNVGVAVVGGDRQAATFAQSALAQIGFELRQTRGIYEIWVNPQPAGMLQRIPEQRMLLLGDRLPPFLMTYPFAEEAREVYLSRLTPAELQAYAAIGLYRFERSTNAIGEDESLLIEYLQNGGRLILELSGMEEVFGRTLDLLGVNVLRLSFPDTIRIRWTDELAGLPESLPLDVVAPQGWSGAIYQGLDSVYGEVKFGDDWYPILGYKDVGDGRAWFIGLNLLYYAQLQGNFETVTALRDLTLEGLNIDQALRLYSVPYSNFEAGGRSLTFVTDLDEPLENALLSYTYSPRWRASVDGEETAMEVYENLIQISLPEGEHEVHIRYRPFGTIWPILGWIVSLLGVGGLIAATIVERRTFVPVVGEPVSSLNDEKGKYAPCATCGFLFARLGPPTPITYPFQTVDCPICGLRMDDEGFQPGEEPSGEERRQKLAEWFIEHDYDPKTVYEKWGFKEGDFFGDSGDAMRLEFPSAREEVDE
jgi:hypothetical protein